MTPKLLSGSVATALFALSGIASADITVNARGSYDLYGALPYGCFGGAPSGLSTLAPKLSSENSEEVWKGLVALRKQYSESLAVSHAWASYALLRGAGVQAFKDELRQVRVEVNPKSKAVTASMSAATAYRVCLLTFDSTSGQFTGSTKGGLSNKLSRHELEIARKCHQFLEANASQHGEFLLLLSIEQGLLNIERARYWARLLVARHQKLAGASAWLGLVHTFGVTKSYSIVNGQPVADPASEKLAPNHAKAEALAQSALIYDRDCALAYLVRGLVLQKKGSRQAVGEYAKATTRNPKLQSLVDQLTSTKGSRYEVLIEHEGRERAKFCAPYAQ